MASSAIQLRSVLRNSAVDPSRVALMGPGFDPVTYSELYRMVDGAKSILRDHDVGPGQRIAIALPNSVSFVTWLLAIFENDNTAVPLDPQLRPAEAKLALDESCANILLSLKSEWLQAQEWQTGELQAPGPRLRISRRSQFMNAPQTAEGSILLHMTSGSNGRPKRILRTEIEIAEDCSHLQSALQLGTQDRFLALPPFHHSFGANGLYAALASGGACILPGRFLPSNVIDCARSFRPSWALVTPSMIEVLVACRSKPDDLEAFSSLRHLVCSTGKLSSQAHTEFFQRFQVKAKIQYGSTETLSATLTSDGEYAEGRVGRPYAGMEVAVFDEDGQLAPAGSIGRIGIGGPTVCSAYEIQNIH